VVQFGGDGGEGTSAGRQYDWGDFCISDFSIALGSRRALLLGLGKITGIAENLALLLSSLHPRAGSLG